MATFTLNVHATCLHQSMRARSTCCAQGAWGSTCCVENVACVWPARSTHVATSCNNVVTCCVKMLRAFGQAFTRGGLHAQHARDKTRRRQSNYQVKTLSKFIFPETVDDVAGVTIICQLPGNGLTDNCMVRSPSSRQESHCNTAG